MKHTFEAILTKNRTNYICTQCYLKFARPIDNTCLPKDKDVNQRKELYERTNGIRSNTHLFIKKTEKRAD